LYDGTDKAGINPRWNLHRSLIVRESRSVWSASTTNLRRSPADLAETSAHAAVTNLLQPTP
jgi:hypothetical protein